MYCFENIIKNKCISDGFNLLAHAKFLYGMTYDFGTRDFENFTSNLFDVYKYHNEIYKYSDDMHTFLEHAIVANIESGKRVLTLEDIRDAIWSINSNNEDNCKVVSATLHKIKRRQVEMV